MRSLHLHACVRLHEPIPLFDLPRSLELGPPVALAHLELAPVLTGLRVPPLILLSVQLSGTDMLELRPPGVRRAGSGDAAVPTGLNLRRDLAALILAIVMIVQPLLRLRRGGDDK